MRPVLAVTLSPSSTTCWEGNIALLEQHEAQRTQELLRSCRKALTSARSCTLRDRCSGFQNMPDTSFRKLGLCFFSSHAAGMSFCTDESSHPCSKCLHVATGSATVGQSVQELFSLRLLPSLPAPWRRVQPPPALPASAPCQPEQASVTRCTTCGP